MKQQPDTGVLKDSIICLDRLCSANDGKGCCPLSNEN